MYDADKDISEEKPVEQYSKLNSTDKATSAMNSQDTAGVAELDASGINKGFVIGMALNIAIGFLQFGKFDLLS